MFWPAVTHQQKPDNRAERARTENGHEGLREQGQSISPAFTQCGAGRKEGGGKKRRWVHSRNSWPPSPGRPQTCPRSSAGPCSLPSRSVMIQERTAISGVLFGLEDPTGRAGRRTGTYYVCRARLRLASPLACALVRTCHALKDVRHGADHATLQNLWWSIAARICSGGGNARYRLERKSSRRPEGPARPLPRGWAP